MSDTQSKILAHGETLVRRMGYSGFSYAALAETLGIRKASIHHHFRLKDDLILALVQAYDSRYDEVLESIRASKDDAIERVDAYGRLYLTGVESDQGCLCAALAIELEALSPAIRSAVTDFFNKHLKWLEQVLKDGRKSEQINAQINPKNTARMIIATLEGALLMERMLNGSKGFEAALKALRESLSVAR
jgi:TetR/AcrR family transcriptional repressor of nem operon